MNTQDMNLCVASDSTQHQFTMDPNLLVSVIKSQAGTLSKAILEGVMNSIDAGCTRVDVTLTPERFVIEDNGKGFTCEEDIRNWFGRFGTPHQVGDAIFGRFRMGRGQMFAFASTVWHSGPFEMQVDLEAKGLTYELSRLASPQKGCRVEGKLYRPLADYKYRDLLSELKKFVAYMPQPVYVNGELFGASASRLKTWTYEDEDAWYKVVQNSSELLVYNQGAFVEEMSTWRVGLGGVVVSKQALEVNFARNSVMEDSCPVWRRIAAKLERLVLLKMTQAKKLDDGERKFLARRISILAKHRAYDLASVKLLTDPSGKHLALGELREYRRFVHIPEQDSSLGCAVHGEEGTFVVTDMLLTRFGCDSLEDWLALLRNNTDFLPQDLEVLDLDAVSSLGLGGAEEVQADGLTRKERAAYRTLKWLNEQLAQHLPNAAVRELRVGKHKTSTFVAWTDGKTFITANKRHLKKLESGLDGVHHWLQTLVHEYMHDTDDSESHSHGEVFYRKFHDTLFGALPLASLAQQGLVVYLKNLQVEDCPKPQALTRQLKPLSQLSALEQSPAELSAASSDSAP